MCFESVFVALVIGLMIASIGCAEQGHTNLGGTMKQNIRPIEDAIREAKTAALCTAEQPLPPQSGPHRRPQSPWEWRSFPRMRGKAFEASDGDKQPLPPGASCRNSACIPAHSSSGPERRP
jgi:hypothetical protein